MAKTPETRIIAVAETFVEKNGRTPTYMELLLALGGGSAATLHKYYRTWRQKKDAELVAHKITHTTVVDKIPIPEIVSEALTSAWSIALSQVRNDNYLELEAIKTMHKKELEKYESAIEERDGIIAGIEFEFSERQDSREKIIEENISKIELQQNELDKIRRELSTQLGRNLELEKQVAICSEALHSERSKTDDALSEIARLKVLFDASEKENKSIPKSR